LDILILTHGVGGEKGFVESVASGENGHTLGEDGDGAHLLSDEGALFVTEDGEVLDEVVVEALSHSSLGHSGLLKLSDGEGHGGESLVHLREEVSGALHLKHVLLVELSLVDGSAGLVFFWDTFSVRDVDIETYDISSLEAPLVNLLGGGLLVDDGIVGVDAVLEDLVGEDGLNGVHLEFGTNARNGSGHIVVGGTGDDGTLSGEHGGVAGDSYVVLGTGNLVGFGRSDDAGEGGVGSPSVNVASSDTNK
jgi:hypothetical protein